MLIISVGCLFTLLIPLYGGHAVDKLCSKQNISIVEHAVFKRNYYELKFKQILINWQIKIFFKKIFYLGMFKVFLDHQADVLSVRGIQGGVHLVQNVQRRRLIQQKRQNEWQGDKRALPTAQLIQRLLPNITERHLELDTFQQSVLVARLKFGERTWQQGLKYIAKVLVDVLEGLA